MNTVTALEQAGIIGNTIKPNDEILRYSRFTSFVELTDKLKEYILELTNYRMLDIIAYLSRKVGTRKATDEFVKDLMLYLGEDGAREFLTTYSFALEYRYNNGCAFSTSLHYDGDILTNKYPITIGDLYALIILFMYSFKDPVLGASSDVYFEGSNICIGYTSANTFAGKYINIKEEDKKNIIGSLWNCIIDIVSLDTINNELKGGE